MNQTLTSAMRRALSHARGSDPAAVTAIIQDALAAGGLATTSPQVPGGATADRLEPRPAALGRFRMPRGSTLPGGLTMPTGLRPGGLGQGRAAAPALPEGATWEARRHEGPEGARDYRLFLPSPREGGPVGLLVMLHGCTQNPEDFARGTGMNAVAERHGLAVAWPQQGPAHNAQSCWNWFRPEDQSREGGEPAIIAGITRALLAELGLPEGRAAVAGLSAGGAMAAILATTHPDLFAAAGVHSGLPAGAARDVPSAFAAMRSGGGRQREGAPLIVFHGSADATVAPANAAALVAGSGLETAHEENGRRFTHMVAEDDSELWRVEGAGHAWFGGDSAGSYADPLGPRASAEVARFALERMGDR